MGTMDELLETVLVLVFIAVISLFFWPAVLAEPRDFAREEYEEMRRIERELQRNRDRRERSKRKQEPHEDPLGR